MTRAWVFLILQSLVIVFIGLKLGGRQGLMWALALSLSINTFYYFYGHRRLLNLFKGEELEGRDPWGALQLTKELAQKAKIPTPKVYILNFNSPQALALGPSLKSSSILLTTGLFEHFDREELEAIIAFQVASIQAQTPLSLSFGSLFASFLLKITGVLDTILREITGFKKDPTMAISSPASTLIAPLLSLVLKIPVGEYSFYTADQQASNLIDDPKRFAKVLWKLDSYSSTLPMNVSAATAPLFIVNPLAKKGWTRYFRLQPSVKDRIQKLIGYYPI